MYEFLLEGFFDAIECQNILLMIQMMEGIQNMISINV